MDARIRFVKAAEMVKSAALLTFIRNVLCSNDILHTKNLECRAHVGRPLGPESD